MYQSPSWRDVCTLYLNLENIILLKLYREVDDEDGGDDGEEFEDGELPPESDPDESEDEG